MPAHHVYANGHEIASRASDGQSNAMGDVCFSPPTPAKVGVPVPYPNTVFGKDIRNGSRTVFIAGKEVALSDKSHFHTSIGDEGATKLYKKGAISNNVGGRAFFTSWSPNVKIEGEGIPRNMDTVTHNHSNPTNTGLFPFLSRSAIAEKCDKTKKRINTACAPDDGKDNNGRRGRGGRSKGKDDAPAPPYNKHWRKDHCDLLNFKTGSLKGEELEKYMEEVKNARDKIAEAKENMDVLLDEYLAKIASEGAEKFIDNLAGKIGRDAAYAGGGALAGCAGGAAAGVWFWGIGAVPGCLIGMGAGFTAGNAAAKIHSAFDIYSMVMDANELRKMLQDNLDYPKLKETFSDVLDENLENFDPIQKYTNPDGSVDEQGANQFLADMQDFMANANDCTRARKCNIVAYNDPTADESSNTEGGGCCAGQTGHHLITKRMIQDSGCNYNHQKAPVVCVEGQTQHHGSHGRVHSALANQFDKQRSAGNIDDNGKMSLDTALNSAVGSHMLAFLPSFCDPNCTRAQLESYYTSICPESATFQMVDKNGKATKPAEKEGFWSW